MTDIELQQTLTKAIDDNFRLLQLLDLHRQTGSTTELVKSAIVNNGIIVINKLAMQREINGIAKRLTGQTIKVNCVSLAQLPTYIDNCFNKQIKAPLYFDNATVASIILDNKALLNKLRDVKFDKQSNELLQRMRLYSNAQSELSKRLAIANRELAWYRLSMLQRLKLKLHGITKERWCSEHTNES